MSIGRRIMTMSVKMMMRRKMVTVTLSMTKINFQSRDRPLLTLG